MLELFFLQSISQLAVFRLAKIHLHCYGQESYAFYYQVFYKLTVYPYRVIK